MRIDCQLGAGVSARDRYKPAPAAPRDRYIRPSYSAYAAFYQRRLVRYRRSNIFPDIGKMPCVLIVAHFSLRTSHCPHLLIALSCGAWQAIDETVKRMPGAQTTCRETLYVPAKPLSNQLRDHSYGGMMSEQAAAKPKRTLWSRAEEMALKAPPGAQSLCRFPSRLFNPCRRHRPLAGRCALYREWRGAWRAFARHTCRGRSG